MNTSLQRARPILTALYFLSVLFAVAGRPATAQEAKPNLTATWKLNLAKSRRAAANWHEPDSYDIKHQGQKLVMVHHFEGKTESSSYVADGKERIASLVGGIVNAKAVWDGASLVIEKQQESMGRNARWTARYTLSQDTKSLVITYQIKKSDLGGPLEEWLVYDKK